MVKCVYICAAGHSGSTLLDLLLGTHSKIESLGEISQLPKEVALNRQCTCRQPVRSCPVWSEVLACLGKRLQLDVLHDPYALNLGDILARVVVDKSHQTPGYKLRCKVLRAMRYLQLRHRIELFKPCLGPVYRALENNFILYETLAQVTGAEMVVDSSKHYLKAVGLYTVQPERVKIILLTRDGRAVFYSLLKRGFPRAESIYVWKTHYARGVPLLEQYVDPADLLRVKYEHLVSNPQEELSRICDFLRMDFEKKMLDFRSKAHHLICGNNMRFMSSSEIKADVAWREKLSAKDLGYFDAKGGKLNRILGYE